MAAIVTAGIVALLEEALFRGALLSAFRQSLSWNGAVVLSSGIYALVHFFQRPAEPQTIHWHTGLRVLGEMLRGFIDLGQLIPGFINLFIAGLILGLARKRTGLLYFPIGLHAGWIFWLKSYGAVTDQALNTQTWIWGTRKLIDGWAASAVLMLTLWLVLRLTRSRDQRPTALPHSPAL
jgi:uncharacterized protein